MKGEGRARAAVPLFVVLALACAVRLGYLSGLQGSPFLETPLGEAGVNVNSAKAFASGGSLGEEPFSSPPLYPLLLSAASGAGDEGLVARRAQAAAGVIVSVLVFFVGRLILGTTGGLLAGVLCALYGPSMYWEAQLVPASVLLFLFTCYWLIAVGGSVRRSLPMWLVAGLFLGAMAGMKTGALVLSLPAIALILSKARLEGRARSVAALILLTAGAGIAVAPFVAHNAKAGAPGVGIAADCGMEFFKANNQMATGLPPSLAGEGSWWFGARYAAVEASVNAGRELGAGQVSRYWLGRGMGYILTRPFSAVKLAARKLGHFWGRFELVEGPNPLFLSRKWAPWSTPLMYAFAAMGTLALADAVRLRGRPHALAMAFPLAGAMVFGLVYTAESSTRLLALPSLALISSALLLDLAQAVRSGRFGRALSAAMAIAAAALVVNVAAPWASGVRPSEANDLRLLGVINETQGKGSIALDLYDRATKISPKSPACRLSLAAMLASDGVAEEAERQFLTAAALDTLSPTPHLGLANLYRRNGLNEQSLNSLQAALERAPYDVGLRISMGRSCVDMGLFEDAEMYFREALQVDPENIAAIDGLLELRDRGVHLQVAEDGEGAPETAKGKISQAMALLRQGSMEEAKMLLDEAAESAPDDLDVVFAMATWYLAAGDLDKAIEGYERCLQSNPKNTIVMNNLAAAYHESGRTEEAAALWRRILVLDPSNAKAKANLQRVESEQGAAKAR